MITLQLDKDKHNRKNFDCANDVLNNYLWLSANQQSLKDNSRTYILEDKNDSTIIVGFYTLTMIGITLTKLPSKLEKQHKNNNSAGLLARLAVDKKYINRGIGSWLLIDALKKLLSASDTVGFGIIVVDAKDGLSSFYKKFGFKSFKDNKNRMFISVNEIRKSFNQNIKR